MSMENLKLFAARLTSDEELRQRVKGLITKDSRDIQAGIFQLARERGLEFTEDEMKEFAREQAAAQANEGELSDSHLEMVSGGVDFSQLFIFAVSIIHCRETKPPSTSAGHISEGCVQ